MHISFYLDEPLLLKLKRIARQNGISVSKCIRQILERSAQDDLPSIPAKRLMTKKINIALGGDALRDSEQYYD